VSIRISQSETSVFRECRRRWWLGTYRGLQPREERVTGPLALGTRIHACLEAFYADGRHPLEVHRELVEKDRLELLLVERDLTDLEKEADLGRIMLEGYLEWLEETGADADYEVVSAEEILTVPLPHHGVEMVGKLDMRVRRKSDGVRLFMDHKALHVDERVLTPFGYVRIGDLSVGDEVTAPDGTTTRVIGVYPQGEVDLYKVKFSDKSSVRACGDHLWRVHEQWGAERTLSTQQMLTAGLRNQHSQHRWNVPLVAAGKLDLGPSPSILDPYALGVLLGDGNRGGTEFSSWDDEIPARVKSRLSPSQRLHASSDGHGFRICATRVGQKSPLTAWYRSVGLADCYSYEKFVPREYLYAPAADRLDLLRGLMDTDGSARRLGSQIVFGSTSPQLRDDVIWLVRSLGGYATPNDHGPSSYRNTDGQTVVCRPVFGASVRMPPDMCPFYLSRKVNLWNAQTRRVEKRKITSINSDGRGDAVCISVAHPDALYVTENFTVTHNTSANPPDIARIAAISEQFLHYHLLEALKPDEPERCEGGVYNILRKVKRSASARPPFYERIEVRHSKEQLRSYWTRFHGIITDILRVREALDRGESHLVHAYPTPTKDCSWKCPFFSVCPLFDDGSAAEEMLTDFFIAGNAYARYDEGDHSVVA
jgi:hypothetical protein